MPEESQFPQQESTIWKGGGTTFCCFTIPCRVRGKKDAWGNQIRWVSILDSLQHLTNSIKWKWIMYYWVLHKVISSPLTCLFFLPRVAQLLKEMTDLISFQMASERASSFFAPSCSPLTEAAQCINYDWFSESIRWLFLEWHCCAKTFWPPLRPHSRMEKKKSRKKI